MNIFRSIAGAWILACAVPAAVQAEEVPASVLSAAESADLDAAMTRGEQIYRYDQAAWHSTDALREDIADLAGSGIRGWVVTPVEGGLKVTYWKPTEAGYAAVYSAVYDGREISQRNEYQGDSPLVSLEEYELIRATQVAGAGEFMRCNSQPFNTVSMPTGKDDGGIYVYFLTPQVDDGTVPMGGHHRVEVVDGEVVDQRVFSKSCIALGRKAASQDEELVAMSITHILDPAPTEIHAFAVYTARIPLYVVTMENSALWVVGIKDGSPYARFVNEMN